jgi:tRNA uridine 5-carbamoylmethylation protein Kti12
MTTFPEERYKWWASDNDEYYKIGPCNTKEEAIDEAIGQCIYNEFEDPEGSKNWKIIIHVVETVRPEPTDMEINCVDLLERLETGPYEEWCGEDGMWGDVTDEEGKDLEKIMNDAFHQWAIKHDIKFKSWMFARTRKEEEIILPHPNDA